MNINSTFQFQKVGKIQNLGNVYAPINVNPEGGGGGVGQGVGIWHFYKKKCQMPLPREKISEQNSPPRDEIVFLKYLVSGALYKSDDREITQIHLAV
jgi:hypothetical protein